MQTEINTAASRIYIPVQCTHLPHSLVRWGHPLNRWASRRRARKFYSPSRKWSYSTDCHLIGETKSQWETSLPPLFCVTHLQIMFRLHLILRVQNYSCRDNYTYRTLNEGQIKLHIQIHLFLRDFALTRLENLHHFSKLCDYVRFNVMWPHTFHDRSTFIGG